MDGKGGPGKGYWDKKHPGMYGKGYGKDGLPDNDSPEDYVGKGFKAYRAKSPGTNLNLTDLKIPGMRTQPNGNWEKFAKDLPKPNMVKNLMDKLKKRKAK